MSGITGVYAFTEDGNETLRQLEQGYQARRQKEAVHGALLRHGRAGIAYHQPNGTDHPEATLQAGKSLNDRYLVLFDGRLFNHRELRAKLQALGYTFQTDSSTEVVLQLYRWEGQEFLKRLRGYFVLIIYDKQKESLFIARDRYGERPLLYYKDADRFLFSSGMAALFELGVPREVDHVSLYQYLQLGYVPAPASMLKGVKKLLPGHFLYLKAGKLHQKMWYRLPYEPEKAANNPISYKQQQGKLEKLLEQAVLSRIPVSEPAAVYLNGSVESAIMAALAARHVPDLKTFSIDLAGASSGRSTLIQSIAEKYKTHHTRYRLTTQDMYNHLPGLLSSLDEPIADAATLEQYLIGKLQSRQVSCVLSGYGADELFAGYDRHALEYQLLSGGVQLEAVKALSFLWNLLPDSRNTFAANKVRQLRRLAEGAGMAPRDRYWQWASRATESEALDLLAPNVAEHVRNRLYQARKQRLLSCLDESKHSLNNVLCADWQMVLANNILPMPALTGRMHGVEVNSPFLDHKIVKFVFSLPVSSKLDASGQKKLLFDTFGSILPKEQFNHYGKVIASPLLSLLQGEGRSLVEKYLSDELTQRQGLFNLENIRRLRTGIVSMDASKCASQIWPLVTFQYWWQAWLS